MCLLYPSKTASPKHGYTNSFGGDHVLSLQSSKGPTPRTSNFEEEMSKIGSNNKKLNRGGRSMSGELYNSGSSASANGLVPPLYPPPNPMFTGQRKKEVGSGVPTPVALVPNNNNNNNSKELHMFVWSSSASPTSEVNHKHAVNRSEFGVLDASRAVLQQEIAAARESASSVGKANGEKDQNIEIEDGSKKVVGGEMEGENKKTQMPPASVMTRLILIMVWRKLIRNPNTYSSLIGLIWSLVSFRWNIQMPSIVKGSISILSDAGLGMAMFSLGLFMALQPKMIACGKSVATFSMAVRFLTGPAVIAATSIAIGLRGVLLHVAIVQAALPQGIVPFVFAKEYNVHPDILSTAVIFGMLIALPITILYYVLLGV